MNTPTDNQKEVAKMKITIEGNANEIAALVVALQERQGLTFDETSVSKAINRFRGLQDQDQPTSAP